MDKIISRLEKEKVKVEQQKADLLLLWYKDHADKNSRVLEKDFSQVYR